jgi:hypothetical protein
VHVVDELVRAQRRERHRAETEALIAGVLLALWRWRGELSLLAVVVLAQRALARPLGDLPAAVVVAGVVGALLVVGSVRLWLSRVLRRAWLRRAWAHAATDAGLSVGLFRVPRVLRTTRVAVGDVLLVRVLRGQSALTLEARREELAACLRVREVRVERERADAADVRITLVRRDPFEDASPMRWPSQHAESLSLWDPIPVGVDERGEVVSMRLVERNVLVGGEPGAGKSVALFVLVAAGALDAGAQLWLLDGKLVELAAWAPVAERLVGPDVGEAVDVLRALQREMESRYRELLALGLRKVRQQGGLPLHLVVVDELAFYLSAPDRKQRQEFAELLRDLVARGRAAGVIVLAATQKPGADVVPTALRDLFGFRLALRCNTPQAPDTILGQGWASSGFDASTVPGGQRGVGFLLAEEDRPQRVKTFCLSDPDVGAIVERAAAHRADEWLASAGDAP